MIAFRSRDLSKNHFQWINIHFMLNVAQILLGFKQDLGPGNFDLGLGTFGSLAVWTKRTKKYRTNLTNLRKRCIFIV